MHFAIIGAGMAGLACADQLQSSGHRVSLFDKARGPGGRMSTRRVQTDAGEATFDHGAQYFTARDPAFRARVADWSARGILAPWPLAGDDAWVGTPGMNAVVRDMASLKSVDFGWHAHGLQRDGRQWRVSREGETVGPFDGVILAIPSEQALPLLALHDFAMAREAMSAHSQPCWTAMFAFHQRLPTNRGIIRDAGPVAWAARNSDKPGRSGPETWVVQAAPEWSARFLEAEAADITGRLRAELSLALRQDLPEPCYAMAHRWRFARAVGLQMEALWNPAIGLGACGDWLIGPRVECAWLSGISLGRRIVQSVFAPIYSDMS